MAGNNYGNKFDEIFSKLRFKIDKITSDNISGAEN